MGIQGLLIALKPYCGVEGNIRDYTGQAVAVDTSSWLHKSVYSIADHYVECIEKGGQADPKCIATSSQYVMKRCQELLQFAGIAKIYLVLDGKRCPLKAVTNQDRDRKRQENLEAARKYRSQNKRDQMYEKYKACIKVTEHLAEQVAVKVQQRFRTDQVEIVWSPYEADPQLVQLCIDGRCAAVITEDSDVLVYSAATQVSFPILYKLDRNTGACDVVSMDWLLCRTDEFKKTKQTASTSTQQATTGTDQNSTTEVNGKSKKGGESSSQLEAILDVFASRQARSPGWGARLFVQACVLAGCDYAPRQLQGVGLVTAFKYVRNAGMTGSPASLAKVFQQILFSQLPVKSRGAVPDLSGFEALLAQSEAVFYYHPVATVTGKVIHLNDPEEDVKHAPPLERFDDDVSFLGYLVANRNSSTGIIPAKHPPSHFFHSRSKRKADTAPSQPQPKRPAQKHQRNSYTTTLPTLADANRLGGSYATSLTSPATNEPPDIMSVSKMANPYQQRRKPLQPRSPNILPQQQGIEDSAAKKLNPFEVYARRHREEGTGRANKIVTAQLPVRSKTSKLDDYLADDVRYVKRSFPKDRSKVTLPEKRDVVVPKVNEHKKNAVSHKRNKGIDVDDDPFGAKEAATKRQRKSRSPLVRLLEESYSTEYVAAARSTREVDEDDVELEVKSPRRPQEPAFNFSCGIPSRNDIRSDQMDPHATRNAVREHNRSSDPFQDDDHNVSPVEFNDGAILDRRTELQQLSSMPRKVEPSPPFDYDNMAEESPDLLNVSENMFESSPILLDDSEPPDDAPNQLSSAAMFDPKRHRTLRLAESEDDGVENVQTSSYFDCRMPNSNPFADHHNYSRRVTLETSPEKERLMCAPQEHYRAQLFPLTGTQGHSSTANVQLSRQFNVYDDFRTSPVIGSNEVVDLCDDEIEETSPNNWKSAAFGPTAEQPQSPPKEKSTIGPAKTLRFRFGSAPATGAANVTKKVKGKTILQRVFQRQRNLSSLSSTATPSLNQSRSRRAPVSFTLGSAKRQKTDPSQTTLLAHFPTRARHPDEEDV